MRGEERVRKWCKRAGVTMVVLLAAVAGVWCYYYHRWTPQWVEEPLHSAYTVSRHHDDTLRVVMIGDSWIGLRTDSMDRRLERRLSQTTGRPAKVSTKGKGGERSRGIYRLMFEESGPYALRPLLVQGADFCVVSAGINDAAANLGPRQYLYHMQRIVDFLLANQITPLLIEAPNVNIRYLYDSKPLKDLLTDYVKSKMTQSRLYDYADYRETLRKRWLHGEQARRVAYLPYTRWNGQELSMDRRWFLADSIHLNAQGYCLLDSCLALTIKEWLEKPVNAHLVNNPVGCNAKQ